MLGALRPLEPNGLLPCLCLGQSGRAGAVAVVLVALASRILEFGMTQSFSGQMDGTSATQMARNPQNRGLLGFGDPQLQKLRPPL